MEQLFESARACPPRACPVRTWPVRAWRPPTCRPRLRALRARWIAAILACSSPAFAEGDPEASPLDGERAHAGVEASVTRLASNGAVLITPHVSWVLHDRIALGMGLSILPEGVQVQAREIGRARLNMMLGRVRAGAVVFAEGPLELTTLLSFGAGVVALEARDESLSRSSALLTLEPAVELSFTPPVASVLNFGVAGGVRVPSRFRGGYLGFGDLAGLVVGGFVRTRLY